MALLFKYWTVRKRVAGENVVGVSSGLNIQSNQSISKSQPVPIHFIGSILRYDSFRSLFCVSITEAQAESVCFKLWLTFLLAFFSFCQDCVAIQLITVKAFCCCQAFDNYHVIHHCFYNQIQIRVVVIIDFLTLFHHIPYRRKFLVKYAYQMSRSNRKKIHRNIVNIKSKH